jgi:Ca2+-binding RTX toxin-like protein
MDRAPRLVAACAAAALVATLVAFGVSLPSALGGAATGQYGGGGGGGNLDLALTVTASPARVDPGGQSVFRIRVTDLTKSPANDLLVAVSLPAGATVALLQWDRGVGCTKTASGGLSCNLDYLSGDSPVGNITMVLTLPNAGAATLTATAAASQRETVTDNNSASTTVQVGTSADSAPSGGTTKSKPAAPVVTVIRGTARADKLTGTKGPDVIQGGAGADVIRGLGGDDRLVGGTGADVIDGGAGNDTIYARDGTRDHITCGSGRDTVDADRRDVVARDCESVRRH